MEAISVRLWIGHYLENEHEWFLVWARTRQEAYVIAEDAFGGEPDVRSLHPVRRPGAIGLQAVISRDPVKRGEARPHYLHANRAEVRIEHEDWLDWVQRRLRHPFGPPRGVEVDPVAAQMGFAQPELWRDFIDYDGDPRSLSQRDPWKKNMK